MKTKLINFFNYYLLIDSSNYFLSVGISKNGVLFDKISYQCLRQQSKFLIVEIDKLLKRNKISIHDINAIVITNGPGSYTGIRIAVVIAKILTLVLKIPVYQISTLEAYKLINENSIVLLDAKANRSYIAAFNKKNNYLLKDKIMCNDKVKKYIIKHPTFHLIGDLKYLGLIGKKIEILDNMNAFFQTKKSVNDPELIKPKYLN